MIKVIMPPKTPVIFEVPDGDYCWVKGGEHCRYIGMEGNTVFCIKMLGMITIVDGTHHEKSDECKALNVLSTRSTPALPWGMMTKTKLLQLIRHLPPDAEIGFRAFDCGPELPGEPLSTGNDTKETDFAYREQGIDFLFT